MASAAYIAFEPADEAVAGNIGAELERHDVEVLVAEFGSSFGIRIRSGSFNFLRLFLSVISRFLS